MNKTLICSLVELYLKNLKLQNCTTLSVFTASRAGGSHNRVSLLSGQYRGFSNLNFLSLQKDSHPIIPYRGIKLKEI